MEEKIIIVGTFVEQNTNAEVLLTIAGVILLPAMIIAVARYAKVIITGKDFKIFNK